MVDAIERGSKMRNWTKHPRYYEGVNKYILNESGPNSWL